jgi:hypothetical protein
MAVNRRMLDALAPQSGMDAYFSGLQRVDYDRAMDAAQERQKPVWARHVSTVLPDRRWDAWFGSLKNKRDDAAMAGATRFGVDLAGEGPGTGTGIGRWAQRAALGGLTRSIGK